MYVSLCAIVVGAWAFKTIDEQEKSCCNMHVESYELFNEFHTDKELPTTIALPLIEEKDI